MDSLEENPASTVKCTRERSLPYVVLGKCVFTCRGMKLHPMCLIREKQQLNSNGGDVDTCMALAQHV
jgi:hypothetical protein